MQVASGTGLTIPTIVRQHVDDAAVLFEIRSTLAAAPHVKLLHLRRFDNRIAAHLDGVAVAGDDGGSLSRMALEVASPGSVFAAAVGAIESREEPTLNALLALVESKLELLPGLTGAFGWVEPGRLRGLVKTYLDSPQSFRRMIGLTACAMHRVDPGLESPHWLADPSDIVRSRVLRAVGELGRRELAASCSAAVGGEDLSCRFWGAWSAVLLGRRGTALETLNAIADVDGRHRERAGALSLQASDVSGAHNALQRTATEPQNLRRLLRGSGIVGDPAYVSWLIGHMSNDLTARLAGEALSLITGADLALLDLERKPPENFESGPNDDPDDPNVEMDPDDGLPWPDPDRIKDWWAKNGGRFQPGERYFMGAPVTRKHCIDVLKNGHQRQRILAAHYLCLLDPGTPLFNTSAPAWRQQRLLDEMK
jgi:uncharacterized protein (TIGR02270 family)